MGGKASPSKREGTTTGAGGHGRRPTKCGTGPERCSCGVIGHCLAGGRAWLRGQQGLAAEASRLGDVGSGSTGQTRH